MEKTDFLKNFADQFDDTDYNEFTFETEFKQLEEWSSLNALAILNMIEKKYGVRLTQTEFRTISTIQELYDFLTSRL